MKRQTPAETNNLNSKQNTRFKRNNAVKYQLNLRQARKMNTETHHEQQPSLPPPYHPTLNTDEPRSPEKAYFEATVRPVHSHGHVRNNSAASAASSLSPLDGLSNPTRRKRNANEIRSLGFSRSRFVMRLISATLAIGVIGSLGSAYAEYSTTGHSQLMAGGEQLWPDQLNLTPSNLMLGLTATVAAFNVILMALGIFPTIRHINRRGDIVHIVVSSINFAAALFSSLYFNMAQSTPATPTFWGWTCSRAQQSNQFPQVNFGELCADVHFSFALGIGVAIMEAMLLVTVMLGCLLVKPPKQQQQRSGSKRRPNI